MKSKIVIFVSLFLFLNSSFLIFNCFGQWEQTSVPSNGDVNALAVSGTNIFAGTYDDGVFKSTNNGTNWTAVNNGLTSLFISSLVESGTNIFAGTDGSGVFLSTNGGSVWTAVNSGLPGILHVNALAASVTHIIAGTMDGVFISTNNGTNWTAVNNGITTISVYELAVIGTNIFAGTFGGGVFKSTNNGTNWTAVNNGLTNPWISSFAVSEANIFAGTEGSGVFLSTNNGASWLNKNQGFGAITTAYSLLIANNYIFAGTRGQSVWRRPLSDIIGIQNISSEIPSAFSLEQNYPNPFNPVTKVKFQVPSSKFVKLIVFDILGKEVAILVNESLQPGTYETTFDAGNLASGIYFYRLETNSYTETKRMTLVK